MTGFIPVLRRIIRLCRKVEFHFSRYQRLCNYILFYCLFVGAVGPARAQEESDSCLEVDEGTTPAEQALCWFNADRTGSPDCNIEKGDEPNRCIRQANAWCEKSSLDTDRVTNACFLAAIRAGKLPEAKEIAEYLYEPIKSAEICLKALKVANLRILSNPRGAEVIIAGDRSYGPAPVDVRVPGDWWKIRIIGRFAAEGKSVEVEVTGSELVNVFDRRECVFGDLIIHGPKKASGERVPADSSPRPVVPSGSVSLPSLSPASEGSDPPKETSTSSGTSAPEVQGGLFWTWMSLLGVGVFGGTGLVLILDYKANRSSLEKECPPPGCLEQDIEGLSLMKTEYRAAQGFFLAAGACLIGFGILYFIESGDHYPERASNISVGISGVNFAQQF